VLFVFRKKKIVGVIFADLSFLLPRCGRLEDSSIDFTPAGGWFLGWLLVAWAAASGFFGGGIWRLWRRHLAARMVASCFRRWRLALRGSGIWLGGAGILALRHWLVVLLRRLPYPAALALSPSALALSPSTLALCPLGTWLLGR